MSRIATDISTLVQHGALERNARRAGLSSLSNLQDSLQATRATLARALDGAAIGAEAKARAQATLDGAAANVRALADAPNARALRDVGAPALPGTDGAPITYIVRKFTAGIAGAQTLGNVSSHPVPQATIPVQVTHAAQTGALRLSFGGAQLDLASALDRFVIVVAGERGSQQLSFTSGTTVTAVVATINTFTKNTGVSALLSGAGVRLSSQDHGGGEFVSVRIVDDGGSAGSGVLTYNADNNFLVGGQGSVVHAFSAPAAANGIIDYGADVKGTIGGAEAFGIGLTLNGSATIGQPPATLSVALSVTLSLQAATTVGYTGGVLLEAIPWQPPQENDPGRDAPPVAAVRPVYDAFA